MAGSWLKRGDDAKKLEQDKAAKAAAAAAKGGKMFRWFMKKEEEGRLTFVDGDLSDEGVLDQPRFYEHHVCIGGKWGNFILCKQQTFPEDDHVCPICEGGDKPALVALFTVVDHRTYKGKDDKEYKNQTRIMAVKSQVYELLQGRAKKRGGLCGTTWDVTRSKDPKSPTTGGDFDFVEKGDPTQLYEKYKYSYKKDDGSTIEGSRFTVADYDAEVIVKDEQELRAMGFGNGGHASQASGSGGSTDYAADM